MQYIHNRTLLVVRAKQPCVDWLIEHDDDLIDLTVEQINKDDTVYLVRMCVNDIEQEDIINNKFKTIFEDKLKSWMTDISTWPKQRDYKTFKNWFAVEFHPIIVDLENNDYIIKGYEI